MASTTTPTLVPAMGCDAQNTRRIATKRATPDSDGERPDAKRRRAVAEEASLHAKKTYDEHVAAAALGDEESRSHRELDAVKELVQAIYKPSNSNSKKKQKRNRAAWIDWIKPFGVLTDESIDISKISQQMTFYRVVHKGTIKTVFLILTAYV